MRENYITITAYLSGGKQAGHKFKTGTSAAKIQLFLKQTYGPDCWSWE